MEPVYLRRDLESLGWSTATIRRAEHSGQLHRLRRGAWTMAKPSSERARHQALARAALACCKPGGVLSHVSAAAFWGLPLPAGRLSCAWLTHDGLGGGQIRTDVHVLHAPLDPDEVIELDGVPVTSLARTAIDLARSNTFVFGVMAADAALRLGCRPTDLTQALDRARRWPGNARARRVAGFADGGAESPYESWVRVLLHEMGLPAAIAQYRVLDEAGIEVARVDLAIPELRLVVEYDGEGKYGELLAPGTTPQQAFLAEKEREARIRALGWCVVRISKADVHDPVRFRAAIRRALQGARRLESGFVAAR